MFNLGVYIDTDMIRNVFETNVREARDLMTWSGFVWVFVTGVIPFMLLMAARIEYRPFLKELKTRLIWIGLSVLIIGGFAASSYKEYASFGRNNRDVRKLLNTINYTYSTFRYFQRQLKKKEPFVHIDPNAKLDPYEDDYKTVLIFIVGETARAKNFFWTDMSAIQIRFYRNKISCISRKSALAALQRLYPCRVCFRT